MFNNFFANKRCSRNSICYCRKMQSCDFGLTMILFILLHVFPILIGFLKKITRQNMLMVHINKKFLTSCVYLFLPCSYLYHIWLFLRLMHLSGDIEKNPGPKKDFSQKFSIGHCNLNSLFAYNFTKVALLKAYLSVQRFDICNLKHTSTLVFLNNKKIPCISSPVHENKLVTDFREKAEIFNSFFAKQCSIINSDSSFSLYCRNNKENGEFSLFCKIFYRRHITDNK